jgi:hypothetical protein
VYTDPFTRLKIEDMKIVSGESRFFACKHLSHIRILRIKPTK